MVVKSASKNMGKFVKIEGGDIPSSISLTTENVATLSPRFVVIML